MSGKSSKGAVTLGVSDPELVAKWNQAHFMRLLTVLANAKFSR